MEKSVIIICRTCENLNRQMLGMPKFEVCDTEFDSLTEAWEHLLATNISPDGTHWMEMIVKD